PNTKKKAQVITDSSIQGKTKLTQDTTFIEETLGSLNDYVLLGRSGLRLSPLCLGTESECFLEKLIAEKCRNHRNSLVQNLVESLKRLGIGYIDILYFHAYGFCTPIEEIMHSLNDSVRGNKVLYIAISDAPSSIISCTNTIAELRSWSQFIALQTRYNLLNRPIEVDLHPGCTELDAYYSYDLASDESLGAKFLTEKYTKKSISNLKNKSGCYPSILHLSNLKRNWKILDEVINIATEILKLKKSPAQIILNWILQKPGVISPVFGARTKAQIIENLKILDFNELQIIMFICCTLSLSPTICVVLSITLVMGRDRNSE
ncbi:34370_t:CDS:2, partial [Gigaspora margarita]